MAASYISSIFGFRDQNKNCNEQRYYLLIVCLAAAKGGEQRQWAGQSKRSSGRGCSKNLGVGGAILANRQEGEVVLYQHCVQ